MQILQKDLGIAILSTDRPDSLKRLLDSINHFTTSFKGLTVHVVDDSENVTSTERVCSGYEFVQFTHTGERLGIAQNTNESMLILEAYPYKMLLNNDCSIIRYGWQYFYPIAMEQTGIHHFCFQQKGLWGAGTSKRPETHSVVNKRKIKTIQEYPQGAILAYDQKCFDTVGYFDAKSFQGYGYSHHDWSFRVSESGIQPEGIHDIDLSNDYFKVHTATCVTPHPQRVADYKRNKEILDQLRSSRKNIYIPYV